VPKEKNSTGRGRTRGANIVLPDNRAGLPSRGTAPGLLLDTIEDGRPTLADRKPRAFAHARQSSTRNGLTALLLLSTYFEHGSTLLH
jgi:hypothetical protein